MTDHPDTLARYRLPLNRDHLKQAGALVLPALRYVPKNPLFLIGAAVVGVVGMLAWRNREKIATRAAPLIEDAKLKGHALIEEAKTRGHDLVDEAKATSQAIGAKAARVRRAAAARKAVPDVH